MTMDILLTGASGFLGGIIQNELQDHNVITLGRHQRNNIVAHLESDLGALPIVDIVIHAAGKAHSVPKTEMENQAFFNVNLLGTANLLKSLESSPPKAFVFISTVAVYGKDTGNLINEDYALEAQDPYGKSKAQAEELIQKWCTENQVKYAVLRLPLIAGPNAPGNLNAMINGIAKGYYFNIAQGRARKSMVMAKDVAKILPKVAEIGGVFNLTDGCHPSFSELSLLIAKQLNKKKPSSMPFWIAKLMAMVGDIIGSKAPINTLKLQKITSDLTFDDERARQLLGWSPAMVLKDFVIK